ncbi:MAG: hypothetical protein ACREHD_15430, partial [Pirellulales bacterium]
ELLTQLPLDVRFSVLEVDGNSADEAIFRKLVTRGVLDDVADDETIAVPVFGRGRAMTALKAESTDEGALAECSGFLCGACSCQVKQTNPGFDLLLAVNWDERLWGNSDSGAPTAETKPAANADDKSDEHTYVPIPAGQNTTAASAPQRPPRLPAEDQPDHTLYWAGLVLAAIVIGIVLGRRRTSSANRES